MNNLLVPEAIRAFDKAQREFCANLRRDYKMPNMQKAGLLPAECFVEWDKLRDAMDTDDSTQMVRFATTRVVVDIDELRVCEKKQQAFAKFLERGARDLAEAIYASFADVKNANLMVAPEELYPRMQDFTLSMFFSVPVCYTRGETEPTLRFKGLAYPVAPGASVYEVQL